MMTAYVAITTAACFIEAGRQATKWVGNPGPAHGVDALLCFLFGAFGLYSIIVGK